MVALKRAGAHALVLATIGSGCCPNDGGTLPELAADAAPALRTDVAGTIIAKDLFASVEDCDIYHRGAVIDLGSPSARGRESYNLFPTLEARDIVRDGATWLRVESGSLSLSFHQLADEPVFVEARIRGLGSRQATVRIDGKLVGSLRFQRDEVQVVSTSVTSEPLTTGNHVVSLHFHRAKRDDSVAEIDWIRVGVPDNDPTTFGAPTFRDLATEATVGGRPHRALALRGPGRVRCAFSARDDMRLQTTIGYTGPGEGEARIHLVEPGKPEYLLHATKLGGEGKDVELVDLPLEGLAGRIVALELVATATSPGGRILFGDPALRVREPRVPSRPKANVVVVLVLTGTSPGQIPPYAEVSTMPSLSALAEESVVFLRHRAPTTVSTGSVASLLTGLSPATHRITDTGARLTDRIPTVGTVARDGRVTTSMFTGNPTTFAAFGFERGWDRYASFSPVSGASSEAPLREATAWIDERLKKDRQRPLMVVVHARGGHPPWTATAEEMKDLPPQEYSGNLNSRRGGQILAKERNRRFGRKPMSAEDRVRTHAFASLALTSEDTRLGQLVDILRHHKVWDSTMLVVTSDIAMGGGTRIPFGDGEELGEDVLQIPLVIRFPDRRFHGTRVTVPTTSMDVARTVLSSMGLGPPDAMRGRDLLETAAFPGRFGTEPQFALLEGSYATRWGDWLLAGRSPRRPRFCELTHESLGCGDDESGDNPFFSAWMWRMTYNHLRASEDSMHPSIAREPATLDADTVAALTVWGSLEPVPEKEKK